MVSDGTLVFLYGQLPQREVGSPLVTEYLFKLTLEILPTGDHPDLFSDLCFSRDLGYKNERKISIRRTRAK